MKISMASNADIPDLVTLINSAYRGEGSKQGWTTEADLLLGELRTDIAALTESMSEKDAAIVKYTDETGKIGGCVYLQQQERGLYLGMLTVSPILQGSGIGKKLLIAATIYAQEHACPLIFMSVISVREELIKWYERNGYYRTEEREPFPNDTRFGIPTQPLEFIIMEKIVPAGSM